MEITPHSFSPLNFLTSPPARQSGRSGKGRAGWWGALLLVLVSGGGLAAETPLETGWAQIERFQFNDALKTFQLADPQVNPRERTFGEAIALLNVQPRSEANALKAADLLQQITKEKSDDAIGALSLYYLGRIYHLHLNTPDPDKARQKYRETLQLHSGNPLAEMAAVSLIHLDAYGKKEPADSIKALLALEPLLDDLKSDIARREFHQAMGFAYLDFGDPQDAENQRRAIAHLKEADRIGITRWQAEANLWVAIGEASRAVGDRETALEYYRKFVNTYKRDRRNYFIGELIKKLEKEGQP